MVYHWGLQQSSFTNFLASSTNNPMLALKPINLTKLHSPLFGCMPIFTLCLVLISFVGNLSSLHCKPMISLGVDFLEQRKFDLLKGKRVGLLTHPAGRNSSGKSTVVVFNDSPHVNLVALFGPEHGIYGDEKASVPVEDKIDHRTGLPVYSLYGKYRKPSKSMLSNLDCLVVDLQDVGVRCYTYISCMKYVMESCFAEGVEVVILDRPNPLGGVKVAGPMIDLEWISYVGAFPIPFVHGLTIAEIALWAKKTRGVLNVDDHVRKRGKLSIVPMMGWSREMTWPQTGLDWFPTSPNIPHLDAVAGYPMTGLGAQLGKFKHGIGTEHPFRFLSYEGKSAQELKKALDQSGLDGLNFRIKKLKTSSGDYLSGVYVVITDWKKWSPTKLAFVMMQLTALWERPNPFLSAKKSDVTLFNKHVGSSDWWNYLVNAGKDVRIDPFIKTWKEESAEFSNSVSRYRLY